MDRTEAHDLLIGHLPAVDADSWCTPCGEPRPCLLRRGLLAELATWGAGEAPAWADLVSAVPGPPTLADTDDDDLDDVVWFCLAPALFTPKAVWR